MAELGDGIAERSARPPERPADLGKAAGAENDEGDEEDEEKLLAADSEHDPSVWGKASADEVEDPAEVRPGGGEGLLPLLLRTLFLAEGAEGAGPGAASPVLGRRR